MKARLRALWRWRHLAYVADVGVVAVACWWADQLIVRLTVTTMCLVTVFWCLQHRAEHARRLRAEAQIQAESNARLRRMLWDATDWLN